MSLLTGGGTITGLPSRTSGLTGPVAVNLSRRTRRVSVVVLARREGGVSSRTRRPDNRGKKGPVVTTAEDGAAGVQQGNEELEILWELSKEPMPELQGQEPDFFEGPQWNTFGFVMQYLWAFGIVFAVIACGIAVATYNEGATDFRDTPTYKESTQTKELLDDSDSSSSEVFEQNPTEVAPPLE